MNPTAAAQRPAPGFTLVELLVSMAITSLLVVLLVQILQEFAGITGSTEGRIEAEREARAVFEILERDLEASVPRADGSWIRALEDPAPTATADGAPDWLFFLASPLDDPEAEAGDVCLVSYRTAELALPGFAEPLSSVHRLVVPPAEVYADALAEDTLYEDFLQAREAAKAESRELESWLGAGVIDLRVRGADPRNLQVTLTVLTRQGRLLVGKMDAAELRKRHGHRFTRTIALPLASR